MKTARKAILLVMCAVLLVVASVVGTLAYFTDSEAVTNTFTVGKVGITLDETDVDETGIKDGDTRVKANAYHLLPGHTYSKDPMVTMDADSEEAYVRMLVTLNFSSELDAIFGENGVDLTTIFKDYNSAAWALVDNTENTEDNTRVYEFRYANGAHKGSKMGTVKKVTVEQALEPLFESFTIPGEITNDQLATLVKKDNTGKITDQFTISVVAHAIQADGFDNADAAWAAFKTQHP